MTEVKYVEGHAYRVYVETKALLKKLGSISAVIAEFRKRYSLPLEEHERFSVIPNDAEVLEALFTCEREDLGEIEVRTHISKKAHREG